MPWSRHLPRRPPRGKVWRVGPQAGDRGSPWLPRFWGWVWLGGGLVLAALFLGLFLVALSSGMVRLVMIGSVYPIIHPAGSGRVAGAMFRSQWLGSGAIPLAVVVENHVAARPVLGLERARVVYEAPAEGGITRYLAIFDLADLPDVVGPVRSVRPYFIDWALEWKAGLLHSGGSPAALAMLRGGRISHWDEISAAGRYYFRDPARPRPHNLFTSRALMRQAFAEAELPTAVAFTPWAVEAAEGIPLPVSHPAVRIAFRDPHYCVGFFYDATQDAYQRWLAGQPQLSGTGETLWARTVALQYVAAFVQDAEGRLDLNTRGGGPAELFFHGRRQAARWERTAGKTAFVDTTGAPIGLPQGPVWITVVTDPKAVEIPAADAGHGKDFMLDCGQSW